MPISFVVFHQEFGLSRFKKNQVKAMKGLEYALTNLQGTEEVQESEREIKEILVMCHCCHYY